MIPNLEFNVVAGAIEAQYGDGCESQCAELAYRIVAGVAWLDALDAKWFCDIPPMDVSMSDCSNCVLGHVVGDYSAAISDGNQTERSRELMDDAERLGFSITHRQAEAMGFEIRGNDTRITYRDLTNGWAALIRHRQAVS